MQMQAQIIEKLESINQEFYQKFAHSFASTRRRLQPVVSRLLNGISKSGNWLDIGCGNGTLAIAWANQGRKGFYLGLDFSQALLDEARQALDLCTDSMDMKFEFRLVDINRTDWLRDLSGITWDGIMLFAVLHHIPGSQQRQQLCMQIRELLPPGNLLYISVWQLQNSPRLMARIKPWQSIGIQETDVEAGDVLMDWRAKVPGEESHEALRYVHIFNEEELQALAGKANFSVINTFHSDGKEGNLGLYQIWR